MSEMTNSEIKNCEHSSLSTVSSGVMTWCSVCGAIRLCECEWEYPTRTPEPTKAENGLVRLNKDKIEFIIGKNMDVITGCEKAAIEICDTFGTPSITKEQERIKELETVLKCWHDAFGTTQLTHAICRLETAEQKAGKYDRNPITKESELVKDKYFTYRGMRADGEFYIEFKDGWPKKMIPNFKEQLLAILPEREVNPEIRSMGLEKAAYQVGWAEFHDQMKQRIEEMFKKES